MKSKAWEWQMVDHRRWLEPSEDMYYYLHKWSNNQKQSSLLDLGCGLGRHAILFAEAGFDVTAFDLSNDALKHLEGYCNLNQLRIKTVCGDMIQLPFEKNSFDYIVSYHVISHTNTEGVFTIFKQLQDILKPDGEMFLTLCSQNSDIFKTHRGEWLDSNTLIKDRHDHEHGIPHFYANDEILKELLKPFDVVLIKQTQNIDLSQPNRFGWHYFIHLKQK